MPEPPSRVIAAPRHRCQSLESGIITSYGASARFQALEAEVRPLGINDLCTIKAFVILMSDPTSAAARTIMLC